MGIVISRRYHQLSYAFNVVCLKPLLTPRKRKLEQVLNFSDLHPFEQLGVLWLLDGEDEQEQVIQNIFDQSGLLKAIIQSRILFKQGDYAAALQALENSPPQHLNLLKFSVSKFI